MRRYVRYDPFDIYCFDADVWKHPVHKHTYFEIIFIRSGRGRHILNDNMLPYQTGDVFLLGPEDYHYFDIEERTSFVYIRFTENFVQDPSYEKFPYWQHTISSLLTSSYRSTGTIIMNEQERAVLNHLLSALISEYDHRHKGSREVIMDGIMKAMVGILARHIIRQTAATVQEAKLPQLIERMLVYVRQHIYDPEKLRMECLAEKFHYSPGYLSTYFKRQTGASLQQYILKYKLKLIEGRLQESSKTISEICSEFGFTDESHLTKVFKKHYGISPGMFRRVH